jgi:hypothetical protein
MNSDEPFFYWRIFAKSIPDKYDFDLQEGFSMKKMTQIRQISKKILPIARFLLLVPIGRKKIEKDSDFFLLPY